MRRLAALLTAAALIGSGCGSSSAPAGKVLSQTAAKLGQIRSGDLDFTFLIEPRGDKLDADEFGFELHGPFALAKPGRLPVLDIEYTQKANGQEASARLISTGTRGWVQANRRTVPLTAAQAEQLRSSGVASTGGFAQLRVDDWIVKPKASDGGKVGGADTDKVEGDLDVVNVVNDLIAIARGFGGSSLSLLQGREAQRLRESVDSSSFELYSGKRDRLLRRLKLEAEFGLDVPQQLREALGELVGAKVTFELGIGDPNKPVNVEAPGG